MKKKPRIKADSGMLLMVTYKGKQWDAMELLELLANEVEELKKTQCKPSAACLFEGQSYLEKKYTPCECPTQFKLYF